MKKMFSLALCLCFAVSLSVTAFAIDTTINQDSVDKNAQITISASAAPTYSVTIPEKVELDGDVTIKANNILTEADKAVKVTITGTNQTDNAFCVSTPDGANLTYVIKKADKSELKLNESLSFEHDGDEVLSFERITTSQVFSGNYSGTITFTLAYGNK